MPSSYQVVLWKQESFVVPRLRQIEFFRNLLDSGWSGSGQTDAAAKAGDKGAAYSGVVEVAPGVWVYQITKNGLALQLTLQGTKYY